MKSNVLFGLILFFAVSCLAWNSTETYLIARTESDFEFLNHIPVLMEEPDTIIRYRWTDKKGIGHYTYSPPADYEFEVVTVSTNRYFRYIENYFRGFELSNWHRDSTNMHYVHNALKKIGYKKFISDVDFFRSFGVENNISINGYIDSLITNYEIRNNDTSNYYYKFWLRRQNDQTDKALICILRDIREIYTGKTSGCEVSKMANDTITKLIQFDYEMGRLNKIHEKRINKVYSYFNYLKSIGLETSAFNLIEHVDFLDSLNINRDSLVLTIKHDTVSKSEWTDLYDWQGQGNWIFKKFYWGP